MDTSAAARIAKRFVGLPVEQRRQILDKMRETGQSFRLLPIAETRHDLLRLPLSYAQQRMLFLWQLEPGTSAYNVPLAVRLKGALDQHALGQALDKLVQRHETLRTRFVSVDGEFHQEILPEADVALRVTAVEPSELDARVHEELHTPFDLLSGELLRVRLFELGNDEHVLTVCLHHVVSDGWSGELLIREFVQLYQAQVTGLDASLPPLAIQYADYAVWQRAWLEAGEGERQLEYWKHQLGDEQPVLALPVDHERPLHPSQRGARVQVDLPEALSRQLKTLASRNGQTVFMLVLAALGVVLSRFTGQTDIRIGAPSAGRTRSELEGLIGFFVNTQVLRVEVDERETFAQLLEQVRQVVAGAQSHQELPFEHLVDALAPERNLGHNPLFQFKINQHVYSAGQSESARQELAGVTVTEYACDVHDARFDLAFDFTDTPTGLRGYFTYATDLFEASTIERLATSLHEVLHALAASSHERLADHPLSVSTGAARAGQREVFACDTFLALWQQGLGAGSGRTAVRAGEQTLAFDALERRSNQLARYLRDQDIRPGMTIALCQDRSIEWVISLLAILKLGAVYLPLDHRQPAERLRQLVKDSAAALLIHAADDTQAACLGACAVLAYEDALWARTADGPLDVVVSAQHPAYVIYTSGSTGQPKGVVISHGALANYLQAVLGRLKLEPDASMALVSTVAADLGHTVLFGALASGRTLHLLSHEQAFDPDAFATYMAEHRVDVLKIVPSHLQGLLQAARPADVLPERLLILGGEASSWALVDQVRTLKPGCRILNHYGPTETTVGILTHEVDEKRDGWRSVPVGQPLANGSACALDGWLNPVAEGVAGELYLGGQTLAQGYLDRPALTAERFVPDAEGDGTRLYRAGDRVRFSSGVLEYLGRADDQVKIRGYRVEPGEVGQLLLSLESVVEAVVLAQPLDSDESRLQLVAWCVLAGGSLTSVEILRQQLAERLPEYLIPAHILLLDRLPLTANGKLDKRALPKPGVVTQRYTPPMGEVEEILAGVWADVLQLERVGTTDNFFELGGDSILSLQIIARAKRQGLKLSPKQLFEKQTIAGLAPVAKLIQKKAATAAVETVSGALPLLPIMARFFELDIPERQHWNQSLMLKPTTALQPAPLHAALNVLLEHHDALRLGFTQENGQWHAAFGPVKTQDLLWTHELDDATRLTELADEAQRSLDLKKGPLLRAVLINLPDGEQRLLLVIHHLAVDGVSWRVLLEDLQQSYRAAVAGTALTLPAKTSSLKRWAERLHAHAIGPGLEQELSFWQQQLQGGVDDLPVDHPHGALLQKQAATVTTRLDRDLTRQLLQDAPAAYRTQINDLLLTGLAGVISRWTGRPDALIRLEGHGREDLFDDLDITRTVGWFSNLYPVRLTSQTTLAGSIMGIKEQLRAIPEKGVGYGLLRYLGNESARITLSQLPQGSVVFNYLGQFDRSFGGDDVLFLPSGEGSGSAQSGEAPLAAPISINGQIYGGELNLTWSFSNAMFEPATVQRLADEYAEALRELIAHCTEEAESGVTPSDFPLARLTQAELLRLPGPARTIQDIYPLSPMQQGMLFHSLFEQAAGHYVNQLRVDVTGLDVQRFRAAWQATLDANDVLRSAFISDVQPPVQMVIRDVRLPFVEIDARTRQDEWLDDWAGTDRDRGFDLSSAPLLRLAVLRTGEGTHRLVYTSHHILMDGWSSSRLLGEVLQRYSGQSPVQRGTRYRDYIEWLQRQDARAGEAFWRQQLAALDAPTRLANVFKATGLTGHADHLHLIDAAVTRGLGEFAREHRITLNTLVQSSWLLVLQRYTGQASVSFGATVAGRPAELPGVEEQLGLFINTLPVIASPRPEQTVAEWLQQVQALNLALREHEATPLYDIQRWAGSAGESLFDTILVFENYPVSDALQQAEPDGLTFGKMSNQEQTHYPLTLVVNLGEALSLRFSYGRQFYREQDITQLAVHFQHLLQALVHETSSAIGDVAMLSETRQTRQVLGWNDTAMDFPREHSVHSLIERQVLATPDAPALVFGNESLSYAQLNARANRLAHRLRESGVGPDRLVGLCAERSLELVIGLLAILKAGGAYVPLDPDYPQERLAYMVQDSGVELLLTQRAVLQRLPLLNDVENFCLDQQPDWLEGYSTANPVDLNLPLNLAYVIYTSGSTGKPKGAGNSHQALVNRLHWMQRAYRLDASDTVLQKTPFSFDVSVWEFFWPLMTGARLAIALPGDHRDPQRLVETIHQHRVTTLHFVPSMLQAFMGDGGAAGCDSLRRVVCSGEALPAELARQVLKRLPHAALYNLYGPTEAAIDVTHWTCTAQDVPSVPIGRPIDNLKTHILDAGLTSSPPGAAAELYLGGVGLARGYHRRPALTAERFVPDPFDAHGGRLYRTGDLARYCADGVIDYAGRIDHQVKIRGLRIELGEIEARLREHSGIREAHVIDIDGAFGKQLVAYLVPVADAPDRAVLSENLKQHLQTHLPDYMVPGHFVLLDGMPLTANGKLDRRALPAPDFGHLQHGYLAPRTELEQRLATLWCEVLQVEQVGLSDNFFALGGHSLLAVALASRIRDEFAVSIKLHDFLLMQTLGELAHFMRAGEAKVKNAVIRMNGCQSSTAPLFCLPPGGGGTYSYYPLAGKLNADRPVLGLVNKAYVVPGWFDTDWQQMVDYYVEQIRIVQPSGPYSLLGWSLGGALAMEVAHVLERSGETVAFLGLVDSMLPASAGVKWVEEDAEVRARHQGENFQRSLIKTLQAFVPAAREETVLALIAAAREAGASEPEVTERVIDSVALDAGIDAASLRAVYQDIAVQDEIETGYKLLNANAELSQAFALHALKVKADCWWAGESRELEEVARAEAVLIEQCSVNGLSHSVTLPERHDNIVLAEAFLEGVRERLLAAGLH